MTADNAPLTTLMRTFALRFAEDRCVQVASSLTLTTLLALVPFITVALTLVSAFPGFESLIAHLQRFIVSSVVPESVSAITDYAGHFSENAANLTTVGILFLVVTALMLMHTIDSAFNRIWRVAQPRALLQRVLVYWGVLTTGPLFIGASLSLTSYLISLSLGMIDHPPGAGLLLLRFMSLLLTSFAFALLYFAVPNRRIRRRDALCGGACAGVCFEAMKHGLSFFIANFPSYKLVYGAFAAVPIFLLWIYLSWLIIVGGAVLAAVLPAWRERAAASQPTPGGSFFDALQVLRILWRAQQAGQIAKFAGLQAVAAIRPEHFEALLNEMENASWVVRSGNDGWVLSRGADSIRLEEVYRLFVFRGDARAQSRNGDPQLEVLAQKIAARVTDQMQMPVGELFRLAEPGGVADGVAARLKAV